MRRVMVLLMATISIGMTSCGRDEKVSTPLSFEQYFTSFGYDFEPAKDRSDLAERSLLVVEAILVDVIDGPIFGETADDPYASRFALFVFESDLVSGPISVRLPRPDTSDIAEIRAAMPLGARAVLYLVPTPDPAPFEQKLWFNLELSKGDLAKTLWDVTTPQGFLLEVPFETGLVGVIGPLHGAEGLADSPAEGSDLASWLPPGGPVVPREITK